jgi:hypothetical protein
LLSLVETKMVFLFNKLDFNQVYAFAKAIMGKTAEGLLKLKIDKFQCKCLKSSLELTKIKLKSFTSTGSRTLYKDKSTESLPILLRPMYSNNFSDAFKYLIYRRAFVDMVILTRSIRVWILVWFNCIYFFVCLEKLKFMQKLNISSDKIEELFLFLNSFKQNELLKFKYKKDINS